MTMGKASYNFRHLLFLFQSLFLPSDSTHHFPVICPETPLGGDPVLHISIPYTWAPLIVQTVKNPPTMQKTGFDPWVGKILQRREWQLTPVFLPGELHGQRSLVAYGPWDHKELDTTERQALSLKKKKNLLHVYCFALSNLLGSAPRDQLTQMPYWVFKFEAHRELF